MRHYAMALYQSVFLSVGHQLVFCRSGLKDLAAFDTDVFLDLPSYLYGNSDISKTEVLPSETFSPFLSKTRLV